MLFAGLLFKFLILCYCLNEINLCYDLFDVIYFVGMFYCLDLLELIWLMV